MDFGQELLKMAGALALVVLILLAGLVWARKTFGEISGQGGDPVMRVLGGLRLGTGKHILLVEVVGEVLVLGATAREMTLLARIVDEERIARLRSLTHPMATKLNTLFSSWKAGNFTSRDLSGLSNELRDTRSECP